MRKRHPKAPVGMTTRAGHISAIIGLLVALIPGWALLSAPRAQGDQGSCPGGAVTVVAHPDDDLLFMSPDLLHDLQQLRCETTIFLTSGDAGEALSYAQSRELGILAAYAQMSGLPDDWQASQPEVNGQAILTQTLTAAPQISVMFMRLPDGNYYDGTGYPTHDHESLSNLRDGANSSISAIDGSATYTEDSLTSALTSVLSRISPAVVRAQDLQSQGDDHPDHVAAAQFTYAAFNAWSGGRTLQSYIDYPVQNQPSNVSDADVAAKQAAINAYAIYDTGIESFSYAVSRQYVRETVTGPGAAPVNHAPVANAGTAQHVAPGSTVTLSALSSSDPDGDPMSFRWTQDSGPAVSLSSNSAPLATFTAPQDGATLSFSVSVSDGSSTSVSAPTTVVVDALAGGNVALDPSVSVTASSSSGSQTPDKVVDGSALGYPADYTHEWATNGQTTGAWIQLTWTTPVTLDHVVLHDRPNLDDQITAGTLTFSDGTTVPVGTLANDGTGTTITFPAHTTTTLRLTTTAVSPTTQNIGLAELEAWGVTGTGSPSASPAPTVTPTPSPSLTPTPTVSPTPSATPTPTASATPTPTPSPTPTVSPPPTAAAPANLARTAKATASSQNTGTRQTAAKAIDGSDSGYPADYTHEWATNGQTTGAWIQLTWTTPVTLDHVVLHDRPNLDDQITAGTLTFSDGTTVPIGTLANDGTGTTITFPAHTTTTLRLTTTAVSPTTQNIGLAELEAWGTHVG